MTPGTRELTALDGLAAVLSVVLALAFFGAAVWRFRHTGPLPQERSLWRRMMLGTMIVSAAVAAGQADPAWMFLTGTSSATTGTAADIGSLLFVAGCLFATPAFYYGLLQWNRSRTQLSDPGDWLNGAAGVMVVMAAGNAYIPGLNTIESVTDWRMQFSLAWLGAAVVVTGTVISIAKLAGLYGDPRLYLVLAAICVLAVPPAVSLFDDTNLSVWVQDVALIPAGLLPLAAILPAQARQPRDSTNQATAGGSLVVLLAGTAQLVLASSFVPDPTHLVTFYAAIAVLAMSFRFIQMVRDLANLAQSRIEARTDELTGVANRRALMQALDDALRQNEPTSLLIIDLDKFKVINDRYGHAVGDELLREVTAGFARHVPGGGLLCRLGGDEFAVLLTGPGSAAAVGVARELAQSVGPVLEIEGRPLRVEASIGVATNDAIGTVLDGGEMLRRADTAMYQAKSSGAGVSIYDEELDARAQELLDLTEDLRVLLDADQARRQFQVYYQPQVRLARSGTGPGHDWVAGAEALIRWQHPRLGLLPPDRFIELIEQNGLMSELTALVVHEAGAQWLEWQSKGLDLRISINLSVTCLSQPDLMPILDSVLALGVDPQRFMLEITESSLMTDPDAVMHALHLVSARGFGISIDDYGTGYSSLSYLSDLPATELKVDRSFTARLISDPRTEAIVAATVELAHRLGLWLVVEGVEDAATLTTVRELGADEVQGFFFSPPLPVLEFERWLTAGLWGSSAPGSGSDLPHNLKGHA